MAIAVYDPILFGDTSGDLGLRTRAAGQDISLHLPNLSDTQTLIGDSGGLRGRAVGGPDHLTSFDNVGRSPRQPPARGRPSAYRG